ncbi:MAG TPA: DUF4105 domain-containing protein [Candidatus Ozemobacteraceae bacterium]|nr:DUF4105 domain-containing protein [Candidatus Ozemobacteraceae bacterium]
MNKRLCVIALLLACLVYALPVSAQVNYRVTGIPSIVNHTQGVFVILRTGDGRIFNLTGIDVTRVRPYDGKNVVVEGSARQADQITDLKVTSIGLAPLAQDAVVLPPFKAHQRPAKLLSHSTPIYKVQDVRWGYLPGQERNNENFRFVKATIDTSKVDRAYFVLKPFPPEWIAAHALMLFTFKKGGMINETGEESDGMFLSIEAYQRTNQSYSLKDGLKNTFGSSWILGTWEDYTTQSCDVQKERLFLYPLKLTQSQVCSLAAEAILQATVNRQGEYYNTVTNNCTNNLIVLLNRVLPESQRINLWWIPSMVYNLKATMPISVPKMLMKRGLLGEPLPEVNASNFKNVFPRSASNVLCPPVRPVFR